MHIGKLVVIGHGNNVKKTIRDIIENENKDYQPIEVNTLIQQEEQKQQSMIQRLKDLEQEMLTEEKLLKQQKEQKIYTYRDVNRKSKGFRKKKGKYYG